CGRKGRVPGFIEDKDTAESSQNARSSGQGNVLFKCRRLMTGVVQHQVRLVRPGTLLKLRRVVRRGNTCFQSAGWIGNVKSDQLNDMLAPSEQPEHFALPAELWVDVAPRFGHRAVV